MLLVIDSVSAACSVALIGDDGQVVDARHDLVGRGHAERLVPMIEDLLAGRVPDAILVDCGPGSFTGLRVGLAAARGLGIGWGVPVSGYSALSLIAAMAREEAGGTDPVGVAVEGGHGEIFVQGFGGDPITPVDPLRSLRPEDAAATVAAARVAGSGAARLVAARGHGEVLDLLPRAAAATLLPAALAGLPPRPIYGRAPDAKASA